MSAARGALPFPARSNSPSSAKIWLMIPGPSLNGLMPAPAQPISFDLINIWPPGSVALMPNG